MAIFNGSSCISRVTVLNIQQAEQPVSPPTALAIAARGGPSLRWHARLRRPLVIDSHGGSTRRRLLMALPAVLCVLGLIGCGGSGRAAPPESAESRGFGTLTVKLIDVMREPIEGANVALFAGGVERANVTAANGVVAFERVPVGPYTLAASANGFEAVSVDGALSRSGEHRERELSLIRTDAWTVGPAIVLGTRVVDRTPSGDSLVFSVDVAVIAGEDPEPLETLTAADFTLARIDCGWGGPRDCASDANGNAALGYGSYGIDGPARAFALRPGSGRHPYLAGVVAERGGDASYWDVKASALKSFFSGLGANDAAGLASVQVEQDATTFTVLGPFTREGGLYLETIDGLAGPAGAQPSIAEVLPDAIRWTAATSDFADSEGTLLWLARGAYVSLSERDEAVTLARQSGLHVSAVTGIWSDSGLGELAMLTGGFVSRVDDMRQYRSVFGVIDQVLAGTLPHYQIEYRLTGEPGLFSPGGNVRVYMRIDVPASFGTQPVNTSFDVAIPR